MSLRVVKKTCVDVCFLVQGMLENNVYFISDGEATMVVDPSSDAEGIMRALDGRELDAIVLTHCHADHVGAAADLRRLTGATVIASKIDAPEICGEKPLSREIGSSRPARSTFAPRTATLWKSATWHGK